METAGEERVRAGESLAELEAAAERLAAAAQATPPEPPAAEFPRDVAEILNTGLTTISSREDAERLLAAGVGMWNSVIVFESIDLAQDEKETLARSRHVSVDCIYMASTALGGISAHYNIDEITLLKFYTSCGKRYKDDCGNMEMASVCFAKADEFAGSAKAVAASSDSGLRAVSKAMFDLLLGSAECAWEQDDSACAENLVAQASEYLQDLPEECEYMASILFNLGLFTYEQGKEPDRALVWLGKSIETRGMESNPVPNASRQAKTMRLCGVCHIAKKDFKEAVTMMEKAEETCHDPVGAYLLLKLSILTQSPDVSTRLLQTLSDPDATLDMCMGSIALLTDAQRLEEAVSGFQKLAERFESDLVATVKVIAPRLFEALSSLGDSVSALQLVGTVKKALQTLGSAEDAGSRKLALEESRIWSALLLYSGSALAERKEHKSAALLLFECLDLADEAETKSTLTDLGSGILADGDAIDENNEDQDDIAVSRNIVIEKTPNICRLAADCALLAVLEMKSALAEKAEESLEMNNLLTHAMRHLQRAKSIDKSDFSARLLVFRIYLMRGLHKSAIEEMKDASDTIHDFDVGALAEAACDARDAGSFDAVLAVLRCVLRAGASAGESHSLMKYSKPGFFGAVFLSAVHLAGERTGLKNIFEKGSEGLGEEEMSTASKILSEFDFKEIFELLRDGYGSISRLGINVAFANKAEIESTLQYLADVAWNLGCYCGSKKWLCEWRDFFEQCDFLSSLRQQSLEVLETRRVCCVMCATASIEQIEAGLDDESVYSTALVFLEKARSIHAEMTGAVGPKPSLDETPRAQSVWSLIYSLEAQCYGGLRDQERLATLIEEVKSGKSPDPELLQRLASIAFNAQPHATGSAAQKHLRLQNAISCLQAAIDTLLLMPKIDVKRCSGLLRDLLGIQLCIMTSCNLAFLTLKKSIGLMEEHPDFPNEERRWMARTAWDSAQMHCKTGKVLEAKRWAEAAIKCATGNPGLSTYIPRIQQFIEGL